MGSYSNMKIPSNLEKPPLFNPSYYRNSDGTINKTLNFNTMPSLQMIHSTVSSSSSTSMGSKIKVPKIENGSGFCPDDDLPCLKRTKFCDESQNLQIHSTQGREAMDNTPLFSAQQAFAEPHYPSDHLSDEDGYSMMTRGQSNSHLNLLNGPSPLGLTLRKSPSLLDLIQRKLTQNDDESSDGCDQRGKVNRLGNSAFSDKDKLKAANFPAIKLRVGTWECASRYDGDLVAKCYYAKRKLVWEVLESSLKSKMEVQWSDISGIRASFPEDQPAVLDIELSRPPLFFREINPQPRKHTLWQSTSDFTDGQATISRHHSVQFPVGILNRHFEKLLQCDLRLKALCDQNRVIVDSCFFDNCNIQIDGRHMRNYQSVLSDQHSLRSLTMSGLSDDHLQHTALCSADSMRGHVTVQGLQIDPQITHHHMGEKIRNGFTLEGLKPDPLQKTLHNRNDLGGVTGFSQHQGSFQLQFSSASPSSVIDTRGSNECSSSSETEEVSRKENSHSDPVVLCKAQTNSRQIPPVRNDVHHIPANKWTAPSALSGEGSMAWEIERIASPLIQVSEKQALNALSLHLLGEPITPHNTFSLERANVEEVREPLRNVGSRSCAQPMCFNNGYHGCLASAESKAYSHVGDSHWNSLLESHNLETGPSPLASHGSYVDLVYLPRIASQPQFLERGIQH